MKFFVPFCTLFQCSRQYFAILIKSFQKYKLYNIVDVTLIFIPLYYLQDFLKIMFSRHGNNFGLLYLRLTDDLKTARPYI